MKKLLTLSILLVAFILWMGCEKEVTLTAPDVDYTVTDNGGTLRLEWAEVADADGYIIYADDEVVDTVDVTSYDATIPAKVYGVQAYAGDNTSDITEIDCTPVVTQNIVVYGNSDPDPNHPSGLKFNTDGTASAISLGTPPNPDVDFYFNDYNPYQGSIELTSPDEHSPVYNDEENAGKDAGTTNFDDADNADAPGSGYLTKVPLNNGAVYYLWIDPNANGWDTQDHYGKMKVVNISGTSAPYTVTINVAYQKIPGLRWCVTP
ncbi:MAG: hypothetical protein ABIL14_06150 [candidate division WOR-3 bacterium]